MSGTRPSNMATDCGLGEGRSISGWDCAFGDATVPDQKVAVVLVVRMVVFGPETWNARC